MALASCNTTPPTTRSLTTSYVNTYTPENTYQKLVNTYPAISIASNELPTTLRKIENIQYVCYQENCLEMDLYLPRRNVENTFPTVVLVHGGGWRSGYRANFNAMAIALAERGFGVANISYRLSGEALYPAAIYDVKAALRWLRENAENYHLNPQKIAVAGASAGGQIASLTGVTNGNIKFDPQAEFSQISSNVQAIINIDGLSDFTLPEALKFENDPRKKPSAAGAWFGGRYEEVPELWKEASPLYYVNATTPPILFITSSETRFSLGYLEMTRKLQHFNIAHEVLNVANSPHSFWLFDPWLEPTVDAMEDFLKSVFNK